MNAGEKIAYGIVGAGILLLFPLIHHEINAKKEAEINRRKEWEKWLDTAEPKTSSKPAQTEIQPVITQVQPRVPTQSAIVRRWNDVADTLSRSGATVIGEPGATTMRILLPPSVAASITEEEAKKIASMAYSRIGEGRVIRVVDSSGSTLAKASSWGVSGRE